LLLATLRAATLTSFKNRCHIAPLLLCAMVAASPASLPAQTTQLPPRFDASILKAPDMDKLLPATVFFRGQVASVQARNSGGIKLPDGMFVEAALVDTSGYSTGIQQKYQAYLITEVTSTSTGRGSNRGLRCWFIEGTGSLLWISGAHLFHRRQQKRCRMKRPMPCRSLPMRPEPIPVVHQPKLRGFVRAAGQ